MSYNWQQQRSREAFLALADGTILRGYGFGAPVDCVGEAVFNTGMTGYQEILTDPSYAGQFVTLTVPEVGNYGCNAEDDESRGVFLQGLVVQELNAPSNWRSQESLEQFLSRHGKGGIAGVDTRFLTLRLREHGVQKAYLHTGGAPMDPDEAVDRARSWSGLDGQDYARLVTTPDRYSWGEGGKCRVVVYDFGVKRGILRELSACGMSLQVVPAATAASEVLAACPDGVFLSNGPADPSAMPYAIENIRQLLGKVPLFGICLGHQLLGLACGAACGRLKFGHHGCNHPVRNLLTGEVEITSQNHNYALSQLPAGILEMTRINLNDGTVEGVRHRQAPAFSVQYHPEAAPGPHDSRGIFREFLNLIEQA